jgi:parallel beta-helix repeat protein
MAEGADDFGIGVTGAGSGNEIESNTVIGNTNGIFLSAQSRRTVVRQNTVLGNTSIQVGNTYPQTRAVDILNLAPAGEVTFEGNLCGTAVNAPCPAVAGSVGRKTPQQQ